MLNCLREIFQKKKGLKKIKNLSRNKNQMKEIKLFQFNRCSHIFFFLPNLENKWVEKRRYVWWNKKGKNHA